MDGLRSVSFRDLEPIDLFERIIQAGESPPGQNGAGAQGEDLEQLLVEYALRASGDQNQPHPNYLGAMSAPAGFAPSPASWNGAAAPAGGASGAYVDPESG